MKKKNKGTQGTDKRMHLPATLGFQANEKVPVPSGSPFKIRAEKHNEHYKVSLWYCAGCLCLDCHLRSDFNQPITTGESLRTRITDSHDTYRAVIWNGQMQQLKELLGAQSKTSTFPETRTASIPLLPIPVCCAGGMLTQAHLLVYPAYGKPAVSVGPVMKQGAVFFPDQIGWAFISSLFTICLCLFALIFVQRISIKVM